MSKFAEERLPNYPHGILEDTGFEKGKHETNFCPECGEKTKENEVRFYGRYAVPISDEEKKICADNDSPFMDPNTPVVDDRYYHKRGCSYRNNPPKESKIIPKKENDSTHERINNIEKKIDRIEKKIDKMLSMLEDIKGLRGQVTDTFVPSVPFYDAQKHNTKEILKQCPPGPE